jgi:hypothetical protein
MASRGSKSGKWKAIGAEAEKAIYLGQEFSRYGGNHRNDCPPNSAVAYG